MSEIEDLRKKRMQQLMQAKSGEGQQQIQQMQQQEAMEKQIKQIIDKIMDVEARQRLANIRLARPEYARQIEMLLIQMAQSGNLPGKIDDKTLKQLLTRIKSQKKESSIKRV